MMETKFGDNPNGFIKNTNILVFKTLGCAIPFYRNYIATFTKLYYTTQFITVFCQHKIKFK